MRFKDRAEAGRKLARALTKFKEQDAVVYAIPRGGVVLGRIIADALRAPLDLVVVRKIGHPDDEEFALCSIAEDGDQMCLEEDLASVDPAWFKREKEVQLKEAARRRTTYLAGRARVSAAGKVAILVDDGIATGLTFRAALRELKHQKPARLIAAVPVAPAGEAEYIRREADELVALDIDADYVGAVGAYYEDFPQVPDDEVVALMKQKP